MVSGQGEEEGRGRGRSRVNRAEVGGHGGEKRALWEEAQALALKEPPESMDLMSIRSHAKKIEQGNTRRAVVIAKQLAVWRKVLKR